MAVANGLGRQRLTSVSSLAQQVGVEALDLQRGQRLHRHLAQPRVDAGDGQLVAVHGRRPEAVVLADEPVVEILTRRNRRSAHDGSRGDGTEHLAKRRLGRLARPEALFGELSSPPRGWVGAEVDSVGPRPVLPAHRPPSHPLTVSIPVHDLCTDRFENADRSADRTTKDQLDARARGGDRTRMRLPSGGFKPPASANSATRALIITLRQHRRPDRVSRRRSRRAMCSRRGRRTRRCAR